ncbi:MAG TPA: pyridoxine 5'-phosphate synthase [Candidatus Desulfofervidus auxilii]|uniref:Pyridoxine 5'-phosphate synthase n=1 Tax=Desulfofervidus auxilii TaxID=1621989 RepID=A0A7C0Y489_DESA2|nr:pyridoxine 5'-phosphate synthase [Candidatus Desulfofervidus auxilii]
MAKLAVNVDHVATVREARRTIEPDPVVAAALAELAGAEGIVVHLRQDRRHIKERDVYLLRQTVKTSLNLEMAATEEMIKIALDIKPDISTLVPERREEITTEGGLDVLNQKEKIKEAVKRLQTGGIKVSIFIDPDQKQIEAAKEVGANMIELHTGCYCDAKGEEKEKELKRLLEAVKIAHSIGLIVKAGHGLNYINIKPLAKVKEIYEFSIGHSIVARAILVGFERAVREMVEILNNLT